MTLFRNFVFMPGALTTTADRGNIGVCTWLKRERAWIYRASNNPGDCSGCCHRHRTSYVARHVGGGDGSVTWRVDACARRARRARRALNNRDCVTFACARVPRSDVTRSFSARSSIGVRTCRINLSRLCGAVNRAISSRLDCRLDWLSSAPCASSCVLLHLQYMYSYCPRNCNGSSLNVVVVICTHVRVTTGYRYGKIWTVKGRAINLCNCTLTYNWIIITTDVTYCPLVGLSDNDVCLDVLATKQPRSKNPKTQTKVYLLSKVRHISTKN